jgi:hypothetical protein
MPHPKSEGIWFVFIAVSSCVQIKEQDLAKEPSRKRISPGICTVKVLILWREVVRNSVIRGILLMFVDSPSIALGQTTGYKKDERESRELV